VTPAIEARDLGKRYGRSWALRDCSARIPRGRISALVGANGAGKSTFLQLAVGLLAPSVGTIEVLGEPACGRPQQLARLGYLAQEGPLYGGLTGAEHLRLGARLNPRWDDALARARAARVGLDLHQRAGRLSGGQRAQLALTLVAAKRPELLLLDEPVAGLDPLARREFLQGLMEIAAEHEVSIVISSHLLADLERICDHLVLLASSRVMLAADVDELLRTHHRITGPRRDPERLPSCQHVVAAEHAERQSTMIVRSDEPILDPAWLVEEVTLEDIVLAYMGRPAPAAPARRYAPVPERHLQLQR
jgi:ABC-2 type transport system ATP-binding protein